MRFGATRSQIYDAQKTSRALWLETADYWDDQVRLEHAETVWEPLDQNVSEALRAIDLVATLFTQIRRECEYPGYS